MIQTLIFDLGNVLLFFDPNKMISQIAACMGITPEKAHSIIFNEPRLHSFERGEISSKDLYEEMLPHGKEPCTYEAMTHAASDIFTPNYPLIAALERFKEQNIRLVLLSNTVDMHIDYVRKHYTLLDTFDHLILSYEAGCRKPDPEIYHKALVAAQCPKESALFVDDLKENIEGARAVGLPGYHFVDTQAFLSHVQ